MMYLLVRAQFAYLQKLTFICFVVFSVHRIGRTGRSGKTGVATTFVNKGVGMLFLISSCCKTYVLFINFTSSKLPYFKIRQMAAS